MFITCPNCHARVSTRSLRCPGCNGLMRKSGRIVPPRLFGVLFLTFNLALACWVLAYCLSGRLAVSGGVSESDQTPGLEAALSSPFQGQSGLMFILGLWLWGFIVLGLCAAFATVKEQKRRRRRMAGPSG